MTGVFRGQLISLVIAWVICRRERGREGGREEERDGRRDGSEGGVGVKCQWCNTRQQMNTGFSFLP